MTDAERLACLEAEVDALRSAFIGLAALFRMQAERAGIVLREASEQVLSEDEDLNDGRAVAEASIRVADQLAEHCAFLDSLEQEGRGIR